MKREQVRQVDQAAIEQYGLSGLVLMENAGRGSAERIAAFCEGQTPPVCVLCGAGNNAGDGYVIARHLQLLGVDVRVLSVVPLEKLSGDAEQNASIVKKSEIPISVAESEADLSAAIQDGDLVVDCLLGTGATGEPRGLFGDAVRVANHRPGKRVAIDLPTGLDCDTGEPSETTFRADLTLTFVATKDGFANPAARECLGEVRVVGIGAPKVLLERFGVSRS